MADAISFRASYETEAHWRVLPNVKSAVSVAEAKVLIARELGLEREFARTFDLELYLLGPSDDQRTLLSDDDNNLILPGTKLIVNRVLWGQVPNVVHSSSKAVGSWVKGEETRQREDELPDGLKCARCHNLARNPLLARCSNGCTKSVCKVCAEHLTNIGMPAECPGCSQDTVVSFVPNRTLAMLVAKIDSNQSSSIDGSSLNMQGAQSKAGARRRTADDTQEMWLLFVDPQQLSIVHRDGFVVLPWKPEDTFCQRIKAMIVLCILATGGGGTSIVSPGTCRVQRLWYCSTNLGETNPPNGVENTPTLQPLIDHWYKDQLPPVDHGYIVVELQWISRYPTLVLLPAKAQPIAGILSTAPRDAYAICLTNAQKQGVTQRLNSEAHFARCSGTAPAPAGLGTILARLNKAASVANEDKIREAVEKMWTLLKTRGIWTGTHWNRMLRVNPLIPWAATIPKLNEDQFTAVRNLQYSALLDMDPKAAAQVVSPATLLAQSQAAAREADARREQIMAKEIKPKRNPPLPRTASPARRASPIHRPSPPRRASPPRRLSPQRWPGPPRRPSPPPVRRPSPPPARRPSPPPARRPSPPPARRPSPPPARRPSPPPSRRPSSPPPRRPRPSRQMSPLRRPSPPRRSSPPRRRPSPARRPSPPRRPSNPPRRTSPPRRLSPPRRASPIRRPEPPHRVSPPRRPSPPRRRIVVEQSDDTTRGAARLFNASLPKSKRPRNTLFS